MSRLLEALKDDTSSLHPRLLVAQVLAAPIPAYVGSRVRVRLLRLAGFKGIDETVSLWGMPVITGPNNFTDLLTIGYRSRINIQCLFNLRAEIVIGRNVGLGHQVFILTESHSLGQAEWRSGQRFSKPVRIGDGCWIGARTTILPGVTIGSGVVVAAGSLVHTNIPDNTLVAGVPAKVVRHIDKAQNLSDLNQQSTM
jgi:maltose O-acetyltransferase